MKQHLNIFILKDLNQKPKVSAGAYLIGDLDTGEIILTKIKINNFQSLQSPNL